jgi:hypothetical protein
MMLHLQILFFLLTSSQIFFAQVICSPQHFSLAAGTLNALDQNQQNLNPAAVHATDTFGLRVFVYSPLRIADLTAANAFVYFQRKRISMYHEIGGLFQKARNQLYSSHALSIPFNNKLSIGIGLQFAVVIQPEVYGALFSASARLGCQYKPNSKHQVSITIHELGIAQNQQLCVEHVSILRSDLFFAQGLSWNPYFNPTWYLSIIQKKTSSKIQFTCGIFPQSYSLSIEVYKHKKVSWLATQSWRNGPGLGMQIGIILH